MKNNEMRNPKIGRQIVVPTTDGVTIFSGMLGRAKYFDIYKVTGDNQCTFVERRVNPYENTLQHLKTFDVYEIINDCSIIVASKIGRKGIERLKVRGMELYFEKGNIKSVLKKLCD